MKWKFRKYKFSFSASPAKSNSHNCISFMYVMYSCKSGDGKTGEYIIMEVQSVCGFFFMWERKRQERRGTLFCMSTLILRRFRVSQQSFSRPTKISWLLINFLPQLTLSINIFHNISYSFHS